MTKPSPIPIPIPYHPSTTTTQIFLKEEREGVSSGWEPPTRGEITLCNDPHHPHYTNTTHNHTQPHTTTHDFSTFSARTLPIFPTFSARSCVGARFSRVFKAYP